MLPGHPLVDQTSLQELLEEHVRTTPSDGSVGLDGKFFDREAAETFRSNVEREFQNANSRLSKRQFDDETKKMMTQLTNRIAGSMSATQPRNAALAKAAGHLAAGGKGGSGSSRDVTAKAAVDKAEEVLEKQMVGPSSRTHHTSIIAPLQYSSSLRSAMSRVLYLLFSLFQPHWLHLYTMTVFLSSYRCILHEVVSMKLL